MAQKEVVFMRFSYSYRGQDCDDYFVGSSEEEILKDTANGTEFGGREYRSGGTVVSRDVVEKLGLEDFADGIKWVEEGGAKSFFLG
jgi:hypothetical protein